MDTEASRTTQVLSVFDFDGTLTHHDSFIPFLRFAFGRRVFARRLLQLAQPAFKHMRKKLTRDELKETLIKVFLTGVDEHWFRQQAEAFCSAYWTKLMRPSGLIAVAMEVSSGAEVTICSASPALVLQPFADRLGIKLIGTQLEVVDGKLTGLITGHNCRCGQKVERLESIYGQLGNYHLRAWGDTRGDYELLAAAQDAHWRHFHPAWSKRRSPVKRLRVAEPNVISKTDQ
jgi:HAD superfamily hydrolase (TIGR01490 family)